MGSQRVRDDLSHMHVVCLSVEVNLMDSNTRVILLLYIGLLYYRCFDFDTFYGLNLLSFSG